MSDDQGKQVPLFEQLRELTALDLTALTVEIINEAADRLQAFEVAARKVTEAVSAGGITSHDAPSDAALAALRELAG